jgi:hypothetical protein
MVGENHVDCVAISLCAVEGCEDKTQMTT